MIKFENLEVVGWEHAIRGMRNAMESWEKSDSYENYEVEYDDDLPGVEIRHPYFRVGATDYNLMKKLAKAGSTHAKYRRMIVVYVDIVAPLYWWKEFDTYKVGTVANSCSTMHKIHAKEFTLEDFSIDHLKEVTVSHIIEMTGEKAERIKKEKDIHTAVALCDMQPIDVLQITIDALNMYRCLYLETKNKTWWEQMIQLLPSSYNQRRTIMMNYEVLTGIYRDRKNHKLDEWREFCKWIEDLPYSELITLGGDTNGEE